MSNQPTGDYRLVPWAYPPIPGGANNSDSIDTPYDFTNLRVNYADTPYIWPNGNQCSLNLVAQDFSALNTANVSTIQITFTPKRFVDSSGNTVTGQMYTMTRTNIAIGSFVSPIQLFGITSGDELFDEDTSTISAGDFQVAEMSVAIDILDAAGATLQHWEGMASI